MRDLFYALGLDLIKLIVIVAFIEECLLEDNWKNSYSREGLFNWKAYINGWQLIAAVGFVLTALLHSADIVVALLAAYAMTEFLKVGEDMLYFVRYMLKKRIGWGAAMAYASTWNPGGMCMVGPVKMPKWCRDSLVRAAITTAILLTYIYKVRGMMLGG